MNKPNDTSSPIRLRAMEPEDLDLLYHIENDRSVWGVSSTNVPYSRYALHDYVAHAQNDIYTDKQVRLIITKETGETIGLLDLMNFDPSSARRTGHCHYEALSPARLCHGSLSGKSCQMPEAFGIFTSSMPSPSRATQPVAGSSKA